MRQIITKLCLSSSVFFMASCGMFGSDEEETVEGAPVVAVGVAPQRRTRRASRLRAAHRPRRLLTRASRHAR